MLYYMFIQIIVEDKYIIKIYKGVLMSFKYM